ncbi:carbohydrate ABC transporter permease [Streptomyces turgidiscabies]|nr:carbohydrate ABC transporter permease [Streptomyces turgidiscabies]
MSTATLSGPRKPKLGWNLLGLLVFLTAGFPVYWMLNTAFKPAKDAIDPDPSLLPTGFTLANFRRALNIADFWGPVGRSLIVSLTVVVIGIAVGMLAALAISRFAFRGRKIVIVGILAVQMVPLVAMIIPVFLLLNDLGQYDRLTGLIITYLTFILPFTVWTLRGFIVNIPKELEEAAMVDGCSRTTAFLRVVFPLLAPGLVATSVYGFIQAWNEYLYALMLMSQKNQTATVWLGNFTTKHGTEYAPMMAGSTMMAVPIVVLFLLVQRKMAAGLTAGAVKG